ncbi:hypothetical protein HMPREF1503_1860 [Olsenella uli MSTE5]|nr:hypothetical protein HMPREF1503_1860 [Olsenella uli MSTE5]
MGLRHLGDAGGDERVHGHADLHYTATPDGKVGFRPVK